MGLEHVLDQIRESHEKRKLGKTEEAVQEALFELKERIEAINVAELTPEELDRKRAALEELGRTLEEAVDTHDDKRIKNVFLLLVAIFGAGGTGVWGTAEALQKTNADEMMQTLAGTPLLAALVGGAIGVIAAFRKLSYDLEMQRTAGKVAIDARNI